MDECLVGQGGLELPAQLPHIHVHGPLLLAERAAPDHRVKLFTTDDPATSARERGEQAQFANREGERTPTREREELGRPDLELALPEDFLGRSFHSEWEVDPKRRKVRYERVIAL